MPNAKLKNYFHLHFIIFIWGFTAILGELISIEALSLVWYRMLIASGFIYLFIYFKKISLVVSRKVFLTLFIAGVVIALHWITFFAAIKVSNVSITLAVLSTGAFFTSILEPIFYKRKLIWYEVLFGVLVIAGLYVIFNVEGDYLYGIIYALCSAFLSSVFSLINGKVAKQYNSSMISFYELLSGVGFVTIYLLGLTIFGGEAEGFSIAFFQVSLSDWLYLFILASVCTAYAFIGSVQVMKYLSPYTVMLTTNLEPVYGILLAFLIFGDSEKMSPQFYYGALIILGTVVLNGIFKNTKNRKRQAT
ncbi:DMT family transporter [Aquimarina sp. 2201CG5-10]|uniref:DMT family transporter n=1 Tax=Aquimarina callyspongiae TaxID=3098150 RepID=UPI002AB57F41|nr:DMT family transporter [Aquimarina sp. 2201CG5-10]MDY8137723.1 DMT family transporter [Aquimarina sp. 2201CG5-10]